MQVGPFKGEADLRPIELDPIIGKAQLSQEVGPGRDNGDEEEEIFSVDFGNMPRECRDSLKCSLRPGSGRRRRGLSTNPASEAGESRDSSRSSMPS